MNHLRNFARIVRRYFANSGVSAVPIGDTYKISVSPDSPSLVHDCCLLAEAMCTFPLAISEQRKLLEQLKAEEKIAPNSWAILGYNKICDDHGELARALDVSNPPKVVNEEDIENETRKTFEYMFSGKWMRPLFWRGKYERALRNLAPRFHSDKLVKIYNDVKKRYT